MAVTRQLDACCQEASSPYPAALFYLLAFFLVLVISLTRGMSQAQSSYWVSNQATTMARPANIHLRLPKQTSVRVTNAMPGAPQGYQSYSVMHGNLGTAAQRTSLSYGWGLWLSASALLAAVAMWFSKKRQSHTIAMYSSSGALPNVSRRDVLLGASAAGIIGNKIAIEGPPVFTPAPGSLAGRTILITGGNHGLGLESAVRLAKGGAKVIITARSVAKGEEALARIKAESGNPDVSYLVLDLADLQSVRNCAAQFKEKYGALNVLMNNAGVMAIPERQVTKDGFEKQLGINHLGHFALTALLQEPLLQGATESQGYSRVINIASSASYLADASAFPVDSPGGIMDPEKYVPWPTYCQTKLANVMFTKELDKRYKAAGVPITAVAVHPGVVRTELARYLISGQDSLLSETTVSPSALLLLPVAQYFTKEVDRGANTQVWLAAGADDDGRYDRSGGKFFQNLGPIPSNPVANDETLRTRLWKESERLTGVSFTI